MKHTESLLPPAEAHRIRLRAALANVARELRAFAPDVDLDARVGIVSVEARAAFARTDEIELLAEGLRCAAVRGPR